MERSSSITDTEAQQPPAGKLCLLLHLFTAVARHQKHSLCCWEMKNFQRRTEISPAARSRWFESKRPLQERHRKNARPLSSGEDFFFSADLQRAVTLSQDVLFSSLNLVPCNWAKASTLQLLLFSISVCSAYCITPSLVQCNGSISLPVSLTYLLPQKKKRKISRPRFPNRDLSVITVWNENCFLLHRAKTSEFKCTKSWWKSPTSSTPWVRPSVSVGHSTLTYFLYWLWLDKKQTNS